MKVYVPNPDDLEIFHVIARCEQVKSIKDADIVVYPANFVRSRENFKLLDMCIELASEHGLNALVFYENDDEEPLWNNPYPQNLIVFRTSLLRSKRQRNEYTLPMFQGCGKLSSIPRTVKPKVGFCGKVHRMRKERKRSMKFLDKTLIDCNFIRRLHFGGGFALTPKSVKEFNDNIINNHFTICARGDGNFSIRFYEVLSMNRIPVYIDNDSVLPFADEVEWEKVIPIVKMENIRNITDVVLKKWNEHQTQQELDAWFLECGDLVTRYLNTRFLWEYIERIIKVNN